MLLRIITPFYHSDAEELQRLVASLQKYLRVPAELVFWNNGGDLDELLRLQKSVKEFEIVIAGQGKNLGFATAVNRAIEVMTTSPKAAAYLLLNPDAELLSSFTPEILTRLMELQGVAGLRVYNDAQKNRRQSNARHFPHLLTALTGREGLLTRFFPHNPLSRRYLGDTLKEDQLHRVDWVSGCALFCPRNIWDKLRGFDEAYFFAVEDVDLGRRAARMQIPVYFAPWVDIAHEIGSSARKRPLKTDFYHHLGMWIYFVKWAHPLSFILGPFVFFGIALRFAFRRVFR